MARNDAFICDGCKQLTAGRPVGYWTTLPFIMESISLEFCASCVAAIQQAIEMPRLPRADDRPGLLARLGLCG